MRNKKYITVMLMALSLIAAQSFADCTVESGEVSSCENEQQLVDSALNGLAQLENRVYEFTGGLSSDPNATLEREVVTYKDATTGAFSDEVFEDRETAIFSNGNFSSFRIVFVKNASGKYDAYWDKRSAQIDDNNLVISDVIVDQTGTPVQTDIEVNWTSDNLPNFTVTGFNLSNNSLFNLEVVFTPNYAVSDFVGDNKTRLFRLKP